MRLVKDSIRLLAIALILSLGSSFAVAQDEDDGGPQTQGDDAVYVRVSFYKYKPGRREEALEIIAEHFKPAGEKAGTRAPVAIHFQTGKWDAAVHWRLEGGMADLEWYRSPNNVKWREALAELEGGQEQAMAIIAKYVDTVAESEDQIGHRHVPEEMKE